MNAITCNRLGDWHARSRWARNGSFSRFAVRKGSQNGFIVVVMVQTKGYPTSVIAFLLYIFRGWPNEINNMELRSRGYKCDVDLIIISFLFTSRELFCKQDCDLS